MLETQGLFRGRTLKETTPLVSVIVNCYNGEQYVRKALTSVLEQTYTKWELIFWDNRSTDTSASICLGYLEPRFKYFLAPEHTRLYEARNYAIENAQGDIVAFLDVDDWWEPEKLEIQLPLFANSSVGLVYGNYWVYDEKKGTRRIGVRKKLPTGWVLDELVHESCIGLLTVLARRAALDQWPMPCDPRYHVIGDFDLYVRLAKRWKFDCVNLPVATYRWHGNNETAQQTSLHIQELEIWLDEAKSDPTISSERGLRKRTNSILSMKVIRAWDERRYSDAVRHYRDLEFGRARIRLLMILMSKLFSRSSA